VRPKRTQYLTDPAKEVYAGSTKMSSIPSLEALLLANDWYFE
jgi:hypothetical protein